MITHIVDSTRRVVVRVGWKSDEANKNLVMQEALWWESEFDNCTYLQWLCCMCTYRFAVKMLLMYWYESCSRGLCGFVEENMLWPMKLLDLVVLIFFLIILSESTVEGVTRFGRFLGEFIVFWVFRVWTS
jgi:hypothetical protein